MIVALLNQKGGVGKTTLATHIAGELALRGQNVILLDADPQGSALDWTQRRSQQGLPRLFSAVGLARETLHQEAPELARRADHVIIDGPPRIAALARSALLAADRVLIPVQPSPYDLWASAEMVNLRSAGVQAHTARGICHQPPRQHHGDRPRSPRRFGRPTAAGAASRGTPAHRFRRERGSRSPGVRTGTGQRRRARGQQPDRRAAEVIAMSGKRIGLGANPQAEI